MLTNLVLLFLIVTACNPFIKKQNDKQANDSEPIKTAEQIQAEEKARQDSIAMAEYELMQQTPFGDLRFGMSKDEVNQKNERRQNLGKFPYNFSYAFTPDDQLYRLKISSDGIKTIRFDSDLKANYQNLFKIISTKYGEPESRHEFPSIFDVQDVKKFSMNNWTEGTKEIRISLLENEMNSYSAICEIADLDMTRAEQERISKAKNKDVIEASEKF